MVLIKLNLDNFHLKGCGGLGRTDFGNFSLLEGAVFLQGLFFYY